MGKPVCNWKYLSFKMSIVLLMKASIIQAGCKHEIQFSPIVCILRCTFNYISVNGSTNQAQNMAQIESGYQQLSICNEGIRLELKHQDSPRFVVRANSFTANIKVNDLHYSLEAISGMEANSLNATAFRSVTRLVFTNTSIVSFKNGLFNGLISVEKIHFKDVSDGNLTIEPGVLDVLNRTLTEFTFEQVTRTSNEIVIDGFTGSAVMAKLKTVKFMYNLKNSITNLSFVGLGTVKTLDLSNCQIETFGTGAFDAISNSVETLILVNNFIKTLPVGLFDDMLPSYYTEIDLTGNEKWICDCNLMLFKADLMEHSSNFIGTVACDSPVPLKGKKVTEADFCEPTTTTEVTTEVTTSLSYEFPQQCFQPDQPDKLTGNVTLLGPSQTFSITQSLGMDEIVLQIDVPMENRILIWFSLNDSVPTDVSEINCMATTGTLITVTNLTVNSRSSYNFCLMNPAEQTISPFDCISYALRDNHQKQPWITRNRKGLVIGLTTVICCSCVVVGFISGCVALKICANRSDPVVTKGAMKSRDRLSTTTSDSSTVFQMFCDSNESAPPLPPRLNSIPTKEYTYATVE